MIIVFIIEVLAFAYYYFTRNKTKEIDVHDTFADDPPQTPGAIRNAKIIFGFLITLSFVTVFLFYHKFVYTHIDSITSVDAFAKDFAANMYPRTYGDYPQLLSIMISMPYVYMGTVKIQLFSILTSQFVIIPCLFALYGLLRTKYLYSAVATACGAFWIYMATKEVVADLSVITVSVVSFVLLQFHIMEYSRGKTDRLYLYSAFLAAGVSAVIKQTGFIWFFLFIFVAIYQINEAGAERREIYRLILGPALAGLVFSSSWYFYNSYLIYMGVIPSRMVSQFSDPVYYHGRTFLGRAFYSFYHWCYYSIFIFPALRCLFLKKYYPMSAASLINMFAWIFFLSYGSANGKLPAVLGCWPLGYCLQETMAKGTVPGFFKRLAGSVSGYLKGGLAHVLVYMLVAAAVILGVSLAFSKKIDTALDRASARKILTIGQPGLTRRLDYLARTDLQKTLVCDGRLVQLRSVPDDLMDLCWRTGPVDVSDYGYIVISDQFMSLVDPDELDRKFRLDQQDGQYSLYVKRSLHR
jgi:hypothetical protein